MNEEQKEANKSSLSEAITSDEQLIIKGVMESATTSVGEIMTQKAEVKTLNHTDTVTEEKRYEL